MPGTTRKPHAERAGCEGAVPSASLVAERVRAAGFLRGNAFRTRSARPLSAAGGGGAYRSVKDNMAVLEDDGADHSVLRFADRHWHVTELRQIGGDARLI
jgi:hypothetical protein